jgi:hypothetical protein
MTCDEGSEDIWEVDGEEEVSTDEVLIQAPAPRHDPRHSGKPLPLPDRVTPTEAYDDEPPTNGSQVFYLWQTEIKRKHPTYGCGHPDSKARTLGQRLLKKFPTVVGDDPEMLLRVIRVAIWDWPAIRKNFDWYAKGKAIPTLQEIVYLADHLAAAVNKGFIAPPSIRTSDYKEKWIDPPPVEGTDPISVKAREEGITSAEAARRLADIKRAEERKKEREEKRRREEILANRPSYEEWLAAKHAKESANESGSVS